MPRSCSICTHDQRDEIDRALSDPSRAMSRIAALYRVSDDALGRHKANHLVPEMRAALAVDAELRDVDVLVEMKGLYGRMKQHLEAVEETNNWMAIKGIHSEARRDLELLAKLLGELDDRPQLTVLISPVVYEAIVLALDPYPDASYAVAAALRALDDGSAG